LATFCSLEFPKYTGNELNMSTTISHTGTMVLGSGWTGLTLSTLWKQTCADIGLCEAPLRKGYKPREMESLLWVVHYPCHMCHPNMHWHLQVYIPSQSRYIATPFPASCHSPALVPFMLALISLSHDTGHDSHPSGGQHALVEHCHCQACTFHLFALLPLGVEYQGLKS